MVSNLLLGKREKALDGTIREYISNRIVIMLEGLET